jgi:hypothetical protein
VRSHRANKAHQKVIDDIMRTAGFDLMPTSARARELGRQVWMRRVSPGCVVMVSRVDGPAYGDPDLPYWQAFGIDGEGSRLQVGDLTLFGAVEAASAMELAELRRLDWSTNGGAWISARRGS